MSPAENQLARSEVLATASADNESGWSRVASSAWQKTSELATKASDSIAEHPAEAIATAALAAGVIYLGIRHASLKCGSSRVGLAAVAEQGELKLGAFRKEVMKPPSASIAEMKQLTELLPSQIANVEVIRSLQFLPDNVKGHLIGQATYGIARLETPLATRGLSTCGSLVVQNEKQGIHYLAHLDCGVSPSDIRKSLSVFDLSQANIYLMKGPNNYMVDAAVVEALRTTPGALQRLRFVQGFVDETGYTHGITSFRNGIYRFQPQMKMWPEFNTGLPSAAEMARIGLKARA